MQTKTFIFSYTCDCYPGYRILEDNSTCVDINECDEMDPYPPCSQVSICAFFLINYNLKVMIM